MQFTALGVAKFIASGIVGIGTGKIVGKIIKDHVTPETLIEKVTVTAAAWVIGAVVTEVTKKYTDDAIDSIAENVGEVINKVKTKQKLDRINKNESTFEQEELDQSVFVKDENDKWVPDDLTGKTIDPDEVINMVMSNNWVRNGKANAWTDKGNTGRTFKQVTTPTGKTEWVWGRIGL